jgi:hypothetical protein
MSDYESTTKKRRPAATKIEELLTKGRWAEARKRLKRIESPTRVGELLFYGADDPNVPDDIFETLLSKLRGKREQTAFSTSFRVIQYSFWGGLCNYNRERGYSKNFQQVCEKRPVSSLRFILNEYMSVVGKLADETARSTICYLWRRYFAKESSSYGYSMIVTLEMEEVLLNVTSIEDLRNKAKEEVDMNYTQELYSLWQKTQLLIQMTKTTGLKESMDQLPLVHCLIKVHVPKVVVWLAVRLFAAQLKLKDKKFARLPLHWAAVRNNIDTEKDFHCTFQDGKLSTLVDKRRMVEVILDSFPAAAKYTDTQGSLPLALLLDLEYRSWTQNNWTQRCVMALMKQAPEALGRKNSLNWMLPFMAGAAIHDNNTVIANHKCQEREMLNRKLNLTYSMLRENPTVVASGRTASLREQYLNKTLMGAHNKIEQLEKEKQKLQDEADHANASSLYTNSTSNSRPRKQARVVQEKLIPGTAIIDGSVMVIRRNKPPLFP